MTARTGVIAAIATFLTACGARERGAPDSGVLDSSIGAEAGVQDAGAEGGVQKFGVVNVTVLDFEAYFAVATALPVPSGDAAQTADAGAGTCTLIVPLTHQIFSDVGTFSAGTLALTSSGESPVTFLPGGLDGGIQYGGRLPQAFPQGSTFTVSASGATAPAFSVTVRMPDPFVLTAPSLSDDAGAPLTVSRSSDLPVTWTAGTVGMAQLGVSDKAGMTAVECLFPESAGAGVIPAALLSQLPAGAGLFTYDTVTKQTIAVGDWSVAISSVPIVSVTPAVLQ
jgi:hypothetical protein